MSTYIVLVTGGRQYADAFSVWTALDVLHAHRPITHLITGGATGADHHADAWAEDRGVQPVVCRALWRKFGKPAGHKRNYRMAQLQPDLVLAFPGGPGTAGMIEDALDCGIEVREVIEERIAMT